MGFFKKLTRGVTAGLTGGLSEFARKDSFGVPSQYAGPLKAGAIGVGGAMLGAGALSGAASAASAAGEAGAGASSGSSVADSWSGTDFINPGVNLVSGLLAADSTRRANQANIASSREQMRFQERMSSTAHQREVADLQAAGLNPLLSVNSGESSPSGSLATSEAVPVPFSNIMASGMEAKRFRQDMRLAHESIALTRGNRINTNASTQYIDTQRKGLELENDLMQMRNRFYRNNPWAFKLNTISQGVSSAASAYSAVKPKSGGGITINK